MSYKNECINRYNILFSFLLASKRKSTLSHLLNHQIHSGLLKVVHLPPKIDKQPISAWKGGQHCYRRAVRVKPTVSCHVTPTRMTIIWKMDNKCWWGCEVIAALTHCWWECNVVQVLYKTVWWFHSITQLPSNSIHKYIFKRNENIHPHKIAIAIFITTLFIIAKKQKQHKCPSTDKWIYTHWYIFPTMKYYSDLKT